MQKLELDGIELTLVENHPPWKIAGVKGLIYAAHITKLSGDRSTDYVRKTIMRMTLGGSPIIGVETFMSASQRVGMAVGIMVEEETNKETQ